LPGEFGAGAKTKKSPRGKKFPNASRDGKIKRHWEKIEEKKILAHPNVKKAFSRKCSPSRGFS